MKIKELILNILKNDDRLWSDENELNQTLLFDLVENLDEKVIELLFSDEMTKKKFFKPIKDVYVFDGRSFRFFLEENKINNSYTIYKNRIGLSDGKKFLKDSADVVLDFPFKDCVLEGGQSDEEGMDTYFEYDEKASETEAKKGMKQGAYNQKQSKRKEIFFNQTLAQDEIDRLFDKKALVDWKRFTCKGEGKVKELKRDEDGVIRENLIIKGNNLIALHSLKSEFAGKVKLIYIDPPYNTGNDGFKYNDNFNHSTWLTFMTNRLEIARDLLSDDGVIFVQCDDNEQAYLKVLMDEVFGRENFVSCLPRITKKAGKSTDDISKNHDYIIIFSKKNINFNQSEIDKSDYKFKDDYFEKRGSYKLNQTLDYGSIQYSPSLDYEIVIDDRVFIPGNVSSNEMKARKLKNPKSDFCWRWSEELFEFGFKNDFVVIKGSRIYTKTYTNATISKNKPYSVEYIKRTKNITTLDLIENKYSNDIARKNIQSIFNEKAFDYSKPEKLLQRIIELATNENDIILDFHLGSGTTAAVAHKMGRQYIGIEQMDYIEDIAVERLKKVIDGEQGGISKSVNWQGGGDFIYFELAKYNEKAKEKILASKDFKELKTFFSELYEKYFLNYNLKQKDFIEKTINEDKFQVLSLEEQKKIFIAMLDNNQMYINFSEIKDEKFSVSKEDVEMSEEFYGKGEL